MKNNTFLLIVFSFVFCILLSSCPLIKLDYLINAVSPSISTQPESLVITKDTTCKISVTAAADITYDPKIGIPSTPIDNTNVFKPTLSYQWYKTEKLSSEGVAISGETSFEYTVPSDTKGIFYYYCVVTNTIADNGDGGKKTSSNKSQVATICVDLIGSKQTDTDTGVEGVVFMVNAEKNWMKIMSKNCSSERWSTANTETKTISTHTGSYNQAQVKVIDSSLANYPAFKWCSDIGEGWSLPAIEELNEIYLQKDLLNTNLTDKLPLESDKDTWYWSSTVFNYLENLSGIFPGKLTGTYTEGDVLIIKMGCSEFGAMKKDARVTSPMGKTIAVKKLPLNE